MEMQMEAAEGEVKEKAGIERQQMTNDRKNHKSKTN